MVNITLAVPDELKKKMDSMPEFNWSEVARQAFIEKMRDFEFIKKFREKSKLTEEDALKLGKEVGRALTKHLRMVK